MWRHICGPLLWLEMGIWMNKLMVYMTIKMVDGKILSYSIIPCKTIHLKQTEFIAFCLACTRLTFPTLPPSITTTTCSCTINIPVKENWISHRKKSAKKKNDKFLWILPPSRICAYACHSIDEEMTLNCSFMTDGWPQVIGNSITECKFAICTLCGFLIWFISSAAVALPLLLLIVHRFPCHQ